RFRQASSSSTLRFIRVHLNQGGTPYAASDSLSWMPGAGRHPRLNGRSKSTLQTVPEGLSGRGRPRGEAEGCRAAPSPRKAKGGRPPAPASEAQAASRGGGSG